MTIDKVIEDAKKRASATGRPLDDLKADTLAELVGPAFTKWNAVKVRR